MALATLLVGLPAALFAQDTFYVLIAHDDDAKEVLLSVHNPTDESQRFDILPIASGTNGAQRPEPPISMSVPAGRTMQYSNLAGDDPSMVELVAHGELTFQAYTMPTDSRGKRVGLREQVPIVDSGNMVPGGTWAFVGGMRRDSRDRSDYAILNLSHTSNTCEHRVRSHDGAWALESRVLSHLPLSLTYVTDVLKVVGIELGDHYTISTSCADNFYVAGLVADDDADRLTVLQPAQSGASALRPPDYGDPPTPEPEPPDDPPAPDSCTSGWLCIDLEGAFHRATNARPQLRDEAEHAAGRLPAGGLPLQGPSRRLEPGFVAQPEPVLAGAREARRPVRVRHRQGTRRTGPGVLPHGLGNQSRQQAARGDASPDAAERDL